MIAIIASLPFIAPHVEYVDLIEINHVYSEKGIHRFTQLIFYDFKYGYDADLKKRVPRYQVVDWRILEDNDEGMPTRHKGKWESTYMNHNKTWMRVIAKQRRETWTKYDVERDEQRHLPSGARRGL